MALSKLELNRERVEEIAGRMKEIIETTWLRNPKLNSESTKEYQALQKEIEDMGLYVSYKINKIKMNLADLSNPKIEADITTWIPKITTIQ